MAVQQKPYVRRAQILLMLGFVSIGAIGWGMGELQKSGLLHEPMITLGFLIPAALIVAGVGMFIYGKARKL